MSAEVLIERLEKVKRTGPASWVARCPAHEDRHPSLAVKQLDDGRTLVKCFAGCTADAIVGAVGLALTDLFPPRPESGGGHRRERRPWSASELIKLAAHEALVLVVIASDMHAGREFDRARLLVAAGRLSDIAEACHVS